MFSAILAAALLSTAAPQHAHAGHANHGQAPAATDAPQYETALRRMLESTAAGTCPEDVMAPGLLAACQQQIAGMAPALAGLGAITAVTYTGSEETSTGRLESYTVTYAAGPSLNWSIGGQVDGKFEVAFTR